MSKIGEREITLDDLEVIPESAYLEDAGRYSDDDDDEVNPGIVSDLTNYLGGTESKASGPDGVEKSGSGNVSAGYVAGIEVAQEVAREANKPKPAKRKDSSYPDPQEYRRAPSLEPFWVLPESARGTLLGKLAASASEAWEFPEFSTFMTLLGAISCAISCNYTTSYSNGKRLNLGLYVIVEQPPATGKSRMLDTLLDEYAKAARAHNKRVAAKNRELVERNSDAMPMPASFVYTTEPTSAAMDGTMARMIDGRFVVASSEQSAFTMLFPQGKSFASTNELLLKGWPGEETVIMRGSRASFSGIACGSVVLVAQEGSSRTVLGESNGTGLAERFMFISEPSLLGHRELLGIEPDAGLMLQAKNAVNRCVNLYSERVFERWNSGIYEQITPEDLAVIQPTPDGYRYLNELKKEIEPRLGILKKQGFLVAVGWLGKADAHILKIATLLHVFECLGHGSQVAQRMPTRLLEVANDIVTEVFSHFMELLSQSGESGVTSEEDAIVDALTQKPLARRQLLLKLKNRNPYRGMGKDGYAAAGARIDAMLEQGSLVVLSSGKLEVV